MWQGESSGGPKPRRSQPMIRAIIEAMPGIADDALTALVLACAVWLATQVLPQMEEMQAASDRARAQFMANENGAYCAQWGIIAGSRQHADCTRDLGQIRAAERARSAPMPSFD
jgi:hypothetical protein